MGTVEEFWEWFDNRLYGIRVREEKIKTMRAHGSPASRIRRVEKKIARTRRSISNRAIRDGFCDIWTTLPQIL